MLEFPRWLRVKESTRHCGRRGEMRDWSWVGEDPLEEEMAAQSSILAWRIPGKGEPGGLPSMGLQSQTRLKRLSSNSSPPGSSVHRISQARILEWAAISSSRGSSQTRDRTRISCITWNTRHILYHCTTWEVPPILHEIKKEIIPNSLFTK